MAIQTRSCHDKYHDGISGKKVNSIMRYLKENIFMIWLFVRYVN